MKRLLLPATLGLAHGIADGAAGLLLGQLPGTLPISEVALLFAVAADPLQPPARLP